MFEIAPLASNAAAAAAGAAAAQRALANAIRACGPIVTLDPGEFLAVLARHPEPIVVMAPFGIFETWYRYVLPYRGLFLTTESPTLLTLPKDCEVIRSNVINLPTL